MSRAGVGEDPIFLKSTFSGGTACLEAAQDGEWVVLRNSRHPDGEIIRLTLDEWRAFRLGVQHGEFRFG